MRSGDGRVKRRLAKRRVSGEKYAKALGTDKFHDDDDIKE